VFLIYIKVIKMNIDTELLGIARKVVGETAGFLRDAFYDEDLEQIVGYGAGGDTTRKIDLLAEKYIIDLLKNTGLDLMIISEERGEVKLSDKPRYIAVIDPLDGSLNYVSKIPLAAVSLVFYSVEKPFLTKALAGSIANVFLKEQYSFDQKHVYLNGAIVNPRERRFNGLISIYTENPYFIQKIRYIVEKYFNSKVKFRTLGSASIEAIYACINRIDLFIHNTGKLRNFDVAGSIEIAYRLSVDALKLDETPLNNIRVDKITMIPSLGIGLHLRELIKKLKNSS